MIPKNRARQIGRALARTAPNDVADVLSRCTEKGSTTVKKTTPKKWIMAIAACLAVILIGSGLFYRQAHTSIPASSWKSPGTKKCCAAPR